MTFQSLRQHRILLSAVLSTVVVGATAFVVMMTIGNLAITKANVVGAVVMFVMMTGVATYTGADREISDADQPAIGSALITMLWPIALALIIFCIETGANAWWEWGIFCGSVSLSIYIYFYFNVERLWESSSYGNLARV